MTMATSSRAAANGIGIDASGALDERLERAVVGVGRAGGPRAASAFGHGRPYPRGVNRPSRRTRTASWSSWTRATGSTSSIGAATGDPARLLVHGLSNTAWSWAPVARRLAADAADGRDGPARPRPVRRPDRGLRAGPPGRGRRGGGRGIRPAGHGRPGADRVVLAGHGFGAIVAAWAAVALGDRCAALVLVDGGWEHLEDATGMDADEFLRGLDEPPEVMRSLDAFLADRAAFDPATWDADQDRAARATVVETHAGKVVPATRPHALEACVRTMFEYDPEATLAAIDAPVVALAAADDETGIARRARSIVRRRARVAAGRAADPRACRSGETATT